MIKVTINGREMRVLADEERALRIILWKDGAEPLSAFHWWHGRSILPHSSSRLASLGIRIVRRSRAKTAREIEFFRQHPRHQYGVFADMRRAKLILTKIDTLRIIRERVGKSTLTLHREK